LIPKQTDIASKVKLCHYVVDGQGTHYFTGTWTYFYMKFSSEDDNLTKNQYGYEGQDFYIIAMPKRCGKKYFSYLPVDSSSVFMPIIYNFLLNSQFLIKAVDSDIPPFNNKLPIVNNNWKFVYYDERKTWDIEFLEEYRPYYLLPYNEFNTFDDISKAYLFIRSRI